MDDNNVSMKKELLSSSNVTTLFNHNIHNSPSKQQQSTVVETPTVPLENGSV